MTPDPSRTAHERFGQRAAWIVAGLLVAYALTLGIGLATLPSASAPIQDPWFTLMEVLILALCPGLIALMCAVAVTAPAEAKASAAAAALTMFGTAMVTACVHFSVLTISRRPEFEGLTTVFAFQWPSVVYALDVLAWDVLFPTSLLFALPVWRGKTALWWTGLTSVGLSLIGVAGLFLDDMRVRNIGIVGYVPVFLVLVIMLARDFGSHGE